MRKYKLESYFVAFILVLFASLSGCKEIAKSGDNMAAKIQADAEQGAVTDVRRAFTDEENGVVCYVYLYHEGISCVKVK